MSLIIEWFLDKIMIPFVFVVMAIGVISIPFLIGVMVREYRRPTFELKKDDWRCTDNREHEETTFIWTNNNRNMIPVTRVEYDCFQWSKK